LDGSFGRIENWWQALHPVFLSAFVGAGGSPTLAEAAIAAVPASFYRADAWTPIEGAVEALGITKAAGYRNVILSNHAPELSSLVEALGLSDLVELTITSAAVGAEKPHRVIFEHAMRVAGVRPSDDIWMVGDNPVADIEGARAVGIRALLADGDYPDSVGMTVLEAAQHIAALSVR
jgi:putative hydrolase of the HAD superfamily